MRRPVGRKLRATTIAILALLCPSAAFGGSELIDLGVLVGTSRPNPTAVSADGSVVAGSAFVRDHYFDPPPSACTIPVNLACGPQFLYSQYVPFRWSRADGMAALVDYASATSGEAHGVSANGAVIVGQYGQQAFRWTKSGGLDLLGGLNGGLRSAAYGANADGTVIVGAAYDASSSARRAFRWTQSSGMVSLGALDGGGESVASGVSADGAVIVGQSTLGGRYRAFRWTATTGMSELDPAAGGDYQDASGVSADGSVVVGTRAALLLRFPRAYRWTETSGMVLLGPLNGSNLASLANGVSADGLVVVGRATDGSAGDAFRAFRWTQATGMISVETWLRTNGVNVTSGLQLVNAAATNADGSVIVGTMDTSEGQRAYLARVGLFGNGMIGLDEYSESLSGAMPQRGATDSANIVLHGAHSNPLLGRVPADKSCVWATGDWGQNDHESRDGTLGVGEFGACHRLSTGAQLSAAVGGIWSRQNLFFDGYIRQDNPYALVEALVPLSRSGLWATATGYYSWGDAKVRRGYLNAGTPDFSTGSPNVKTWAVRGRLDWENALQLGDAGISPYGELSYVETKVDAYAETGGGFPAYFDARRQGTTQLRLGVNAIKPITRDVRLLGLLEGVHQFNDEGSNTSGEVLGLFTFTYPGEQYKQNWLRAGIGAEAKLGGGAASLMFNATTEGQDPNYWLSASYRIAF